MIGMTTLDSQGRPTRRNSQIIKHKPKSKKRLFADLGALALQNPDFAMFTDVGSQGLKHPKVGNETYGRMSCIYLYTGSHETRMRLERALDALEYRIECEYSPGSGTLEIVVSYFKGHHWNE
jgi:hypothetical protein